MLPTDFERRDGSILRSLKVLRECKGYQNLYSILRYFKTNICNPNDSRTSRSSLIFPYGRTTVSVSKLYCKVMPSLLVLVLVLVGGARCGSNPHHQPTDYAAWLREDDIAGLKVT